MIELVPWLAALAAALAAAIGIYFGGKSTGGAEAGAEVANKINEQAAEAAKVKHDAQSNVYRLPDAAAELRGKWMRKPPAGGWSTALRPALFK